MTKNLFAAIGLLSTHTAAFVVGGIAGIAFCCSELDKIKSKEKP